MVSCALMESTEASAKESSVTWTKLIFIATKMALPFLQIKHDGVECSKAASGSSGRLTF
jgi:hypothetical protein